MRWPHLIAGAAAFALTSCAALGGDNGGGANLPNRGIVPYERVVTEDTDYIVTPEGTTRYLDPSAVIDGDRVHLYVTVSDGTRRYIARLSSGVDGQTFGAPEAITLGGQAEGEGPSVLIADDGTYLMAFVSSEARIDVASSSDGVTFTVIGGFDGRQGMAVSSPSLIQVEEGFELFYTEAGTTIARATADAALDFAFEAVVFEPGVDCIDVAGEAETCWDADAVTDAEVRLTKTATGRTLYRMFYAGTTGGSTDLGFAASDDGVTWSRYKFNPVVDDRLKQVGPTNVRQGERYLLYWAENAPSGHGIALAINDASAPSEAF